MIELWLVVNLVIRHKFLWINAIRDVDDGLGTVFSEKSGIFGCDGGNAVDGFQSIKLIFAKGFGQMIEIPTFRRKFGFLCCAFPNFVFHIVRSQND